VETAGGTATFFALQEAGSRGIVDHYWLGKDLERAFNELYFYEAAESLQTDEWRYLRNMVSYAGVAKVRVKDGSRRELLVLKNFVASLQKPRMLDIKVGRVTGVAHWHGQTPINAIGSIARDLHTNTAAEGLRLEGFLGPPSYLEADENPLRDLGGELLWGKKVVKRAKKVAFQMMSMFEVLSAFSDLRKRRTVERDTRSQSLQSQGSESSVASSSSTGGTAGMTLLTPGEHAELAMLSLTGKLCEMIGECEDIPTPQKWVGSGIALIMDAASSLPRHICMSSTTSLAWINNHMRIHIFDFGRSELNHPDHHATLSLAEQRNRQEFWSAYQSGLRRLLWQAGRLYWNRYCATHWDLLEIRVYQHEAIACHRFIGSVTVELRHVVGKTSSLQLMMDEHAVFGTNMKQAMLNFVVSWQTYPKPSRLAGVWIVTVHTASNLPSQSQKFGGSSSTFAAVRVSEAGSKRSAHGRTSVAMSSSNPEWFEELEFPMAEIGGLAGADAFRESMGLVAEKESELFLTDDLLSDVLPPPLEAGAREEIIGNEEVPFFDTLFERSTS